VQYFAFYALKPASGAAVPKFLIGQVEVEFLPCIKFIDNQWISGAFKKNLKSTGT